MSTDALTACKIVITGVTGQVARPLATSLARDNEVYGAARFTDGAARQALEASGVRCVPVDLVTGDVARLPADADYVLDFAVAKTTDWENDLAANSGGLAYLMEHHQQAKAFLHCSSTAVYKPAGHRAFTEDAPLGDNHGAFRPSYDDRPPLRSLRRRGRVARHAPPDDAVRKCDTRARRHPQRVQPHSRG
jgi:UDP-glucuronate 4-epimerase